MNNRSDSNQHLKSGDATDQTMNKGHGSATGLSDEVSPGQAWFTNNFGQEDDNNLLDYFLNGTDNVLGTLPPTPEGEPLTMAGTNISPFHSNGDPGGIGIATNNTSSTTQMMPSSFQHQQAQQPPKQKNTHIRFSIDQNHNHTKKATNVPTAAITASISLGNEIQLPPTPVVQHFYARPTTSSSTTAAAPTPQISNPQQQLLHQQQQQHLQMHQQAQHSLNNLNIHDVTSQYSAGQTPSTTKPSRQPVSMLYSRAASQQPVLSSLGHSNSQQSTSMAPPAALASISYQGGTSTSSQNIMQQQQQLPQHVPHNQQRQQQPHQQQQQQQPQQITSRSSSHESFNNLSPISPATICTSEVMMLPPPPRYSAIKSSDNRANSSNIPLHSQRQQQQPQSQQQQQQHHQPQQQQQQQQQWQHMTQRSNQPTPVDNQSIEQIQSHIAQSSWLQRVRTIAMNTPHLMSATTSNTSATTQQQQGSNNAITTNNISQQGGIFTTNNTGTTAAPMAPNTTMQPPPPQQPQQQQTLSQPQQIFITTIPHPSNGTTINTDILPIPTATNPAALSAAALHHFNAASLNTTTAVESKEKRERRLARNRESARQSRRRKKELLINLEAQVNKLHSNIENERRRQLTIMEKELVKAKEKLLKEANSKFENGNGGNEGESLTHGDLDEVKKNLNLAIRDGGPNVATRRAAAEFQYNALRQLFLPYYHQVFLAMSLHEEGFFTGAKEKRSRENKGSGRISSKMVGEEIHKSNGTTKGSQSCNANDDEKVWPLLCYELTVSLDQEERLLQAFKRLRDDTSMPQNRSKVSVAVTMVSSLRNGTLCQSQTAAHRNEIGLLDILTPQQTVAFMKWFANNRDRCLKLFGLSEMDGTMVTEIGDNCLDEGREGNDDQVKIKSSDSLNDICKQLTEALKIVKTEL